MVSRTVLSRAVRSLLHSLANLLTFSSGIQGPEVAVRNRLVPRFSFNEIFTYGFLQHRRSRNGNSHWHNHWKWHWKKLTLLRKLGMWMENDTLWLPIKHSPEEGQKNDNFDEHLESLLKLNINYSLVAFISSWPNGIVLSVMMKSTMAHWFLIGFWNDTVRDLKI